jgi:hypothetical protein
LEDWNALLAQARMDQKDLAAALDKSPSVISALVNHVKGPAAAGKKVRKQALDYLYRRIRSSESVSDRPSESVEPGVAHEASAEYRTTDEWKRHAAQLEAEVKRLRLALRALTEPIEPP